MLRMLTNFGVKSQERFMAGPEDDISQSEKRRILREQATTMHQHAVAWSGEISQGRFGALGTPHVTGSAPAQQIPTLPSSSPWSGAQPQPPIEPPLGFDNPALESLELSSASSAQGNSAAQCADASLSVAPPADDVERGTELPLRRRKL
jgi:hypothetical protein